MEPLRVFTAAVLLGAHAFPRHSFPTSGSLLASSRDFKRYLLDPEHGLGLHEDDVLDLFDSDNNPSGQLEAIAEHLEQFGRKTRDQGVRNLLIHYAGHGFFLEDNQAYVLALANTKATSPGATALKVMDLASQVRDSAKFARRFVIMDCCFAGEAQRYFLSESGSEMRKMHEAFAEEGRRSLRDIPRRGTSLLCACDRYNAAIDRRGDRHTMFSGALLWVLENGDPHCPKYLSLAELRDSIWERLRDAPEAVRPVLVSPDQREGDIASHVELFPNRAFINGRNRQIDELRPKEEPGDAGGDEPKTLQGTRKAHVTDFLKAPTDDRATLVTHSTAHVLKRHPFWIVLILLTVLITVFLLFSMVSMSDTVLVASDEFRGIVPLEKPITNIIIVHGMGRHCIGYGDKLVSNLFEELTESTPESIQQTYMRYIEALRIPSRTMPVSKASGREVYQSDVFYPPRTGDCQRLKATYEGTGERIVDTEETLESVVLSEDALCQFINGTKISGQPTIHCHKLFVHKAKYDKEGGENPEYITGFVRVFEREVTPKTRVMVYEVTWSPAIRWLKQSLRDVEQFNSSMSENPLNRKLNSEVVNARMSDAMGYMSDSGILINYDIVQALCLTLANGRTIQTAYPFNCDTTHLQSAGDDFSRRNDVVLISHSLGARIVLDSIGLLALGPGNQGNESGQRRGLISVINDKFGRIGAKIPPSPVASLAREDNVEAIWGKRVPQLARAVNSIYMFASEVPLLVASQTSPFKETYSLGEGFGEFLSLHGNGADGKAEKPLQVVSFHDPDDVLSYNLSCWYYETVLKRLPETKERLEIEAAFRAEQKKSEIGVERRALRHTMFNGGCFDRTLASIGDRTLFEEIWREKSNLLALRDVTVRLRGLRVAGLAVDPLQVHSNYFVDKVVHRLLVNGHGSGNAEGSHL